MLTKIRFYALLPGAVMLAWLSFPPGQPSGGLALPPERTLREAAVSRGILVGAAAAYFPLNDGIYSALLGAEFSQLEPENEMKFGAIHPRPDSDPVPYNFAPADALVAFAQAHQMKVRGHTLVWHNQVPRWVREGQFTSVQLADILHRHITTEVTHFGDQVYAWDVVNEAFNDDGTLHSSIWYDKPGIGFAGQGTKYIEEAFNWAHAANPGTKLFYNDYNGETVNAKSDAIYAMAADFKQRGVPLAGVGFQCHFGLDFDDPAKIRSFEQNLDRLAKLGLELHITELDIRLHDSSPASLAAQAKLYGEIASLCVRNPACKVIQTWGVMDKYSWVPMVNRGFGWALMFDAEGHRKPAVDAVLSALTETGQ